MTPEELKNILDKNNSLQSEVLRLNAESTHKDWVIRKLRHQIYGSQSEKIITDEPEQFLFNEIEKEAATVLPEQTELIDGYSRKKSSRAWQRMH